MADNNQNLGFGSNLTKLDLIKLKKYLCYRRQNLEVPFEMQPPFPVVNAEIPMHSPWYPQIYVPQPLFRVESSPTVDADLDLEIPEWKPEIFTGGETTNLDIVNMLYDSNIRFLEINRKQSLGGDEEKENKEKLPTAEGAVCQHSVH